MKQYKIYVKSHSNTLHLKADHVKEISLLSGLFIAFYVGDIEEPITDGNKVLSKNVTGLFASSDIIAILETTGSKL